MCVSGAIWRQVNSRAVRRWRLEEIKVECNWEGCWPQERVQNAAWDHTGRGRTHRDQRVCQLPHGLPPKPFFDLHPSDLIINLPRGLPFPSSHTQSNPESQKGKEGWGWASDHVNPPLLLCISTFQPLLPHLCKAEKWKQDTQDSAEVHAQCAYMQIQIWQRHTLQTLLKKVL